MSNNTHGMSKTPEYQAWIEMKQRCFNSNHKSYSDYGGRGIKICDRWLNSSENFLADMGSRPTAKHSLDRINNDADYSSKNCRWATSTEQNNNKRTNRLITIGNKTYTIAQWTKEMGFNERVIWNRLNLGWSDFDAVMTAVETDRLITIKNDTRTIAQWTKEMGFSKNVINNRLKYGWSKSDAVLIPVRKYNR